MHELQQFVDALADLLLGPLPDREGERDIVADGHVLEGCVVLEDEADVTALGGDPRRVLAREEHLAGVGTLQARDDPQEGRLPRAARPEDGGERALLDLERDVVEGKKRAEALRDVADLDRHQIVSSRGRIRVMTTSTSTAVAASTTATA